MKEEEIHGPVGLFDDEDDDDSDDDEIDIGKLRAYEKSKLSYYLAMAVELYESCDGYEIEMSSNKLDLRFIPDDMEFVHPPEEGVDEAPANYEGLDSQIRDTQQTKINLSWDEDEPQRRKILKRKFSERELEELDFKEFVASDESDSDDGENEDITNNQSDKKHKLRDSYRSLLQFGDGSDGSDNDGDEGMVVTFNTGLEDISKRIMEKKGKASETVWEVCLRKRREKRKANKYKHSSEDDGDVDNFFVDEPSLKRRKKEGKENEDMEKEAVASRAELELLLANNEGAPKGYNLKSKNTKGKKQKHYDYPVVDVEKIPVVDDPRFASLLTSSAYALDPTDPQFKRSATYARQISKRRLKRGTKILTNDPGTNKVEHEDSDILPSKEKQNLSSMVKSVKMKLKQVRLPSKHMVLNK